METMTKAKAHFLIIIIVLCVLHVYSVVYSVYSVQLKPNILSQFFGSQCHLIQKNWLCLSFRFSCVRFFPFIFGFFLFIFSVEHFSTLHLSFLFENGVHSRRYGVYDWIHSQWRICTVNTTQSLYILFCVHMYMTRRKYKRFLTMRRIIHCSILHTFVYSQPTLLSILRVYTLYSVYMYKGKTKQRDVLLHEFMDNISMGKMYMMK